MYDGLSFDDVLLLPQYSEIVPKETNIESYITNSIKLRVPLISAAMDTVTESDMAIAMAKMGGIGCIHKNLSINEQVQEVKKVKNYENAIVRNPVTVSPETPVQKIMEIQKSLNISGIPVTNNGKLVGIITNRDVRFVENLNISAQDVMTKHNLITVNDKISLSEAKSLLHKYRIERLIVTDDNDQCIGLITVKDILNINKYPYSSKDDNSRLRVAAAIGVDDLDRALELSRAETDLLILDTAHGHSKLAIDSLKLLKSRIPQEIVVGNIVTAQAAKDLIQAGADALKVGIGPGSICTTRVIAGIGVPQFSAIMNVTKACIDTDIKIIADGGIKHSGDIAKALAAGAHTVMLGSLFAGTDEAPGEIIVYNNRTYKNYRGMGSLSAMRQGSSSRYFQNKNASKLVAEGVEARVPYKGTVNNVVEQLKGGIKASLGYTGNHNIQELHKSAKFTKITLSSAKESHPHSVMISSAPPNYFSEEIQ
ncbi:MAG: inosine-5'-monophosphate dehydrogenase [Candidatus Xenolissoclinum pacificiensis L6]|uniref:Inosine-5'-monophosphate dehydrogenase n=1 Tax=Candidatus Xenolissoclinum pacificiensis L6 TaxID=1401685 RepID=W2V107_9RICK|nr:MAG: inosine-5'-monophosphate dehydrogenase [Candidatus Xenolissoclinum pacificiensis L6]